MFLSSTLLTFLLVLSVTAKPVVISDKMMKLSIQRRLNLSGARNLIRQDQAHAKSLLARGKAMAASNPYTATTTLTDFATSATDSTTLTFTSSASDPDPTGIDEPIDNVVVTYTATIGVGNPPRNYSLIIDTGSSNTWIGASIRYERTSTTFETGQNVSVEYGSGSFSGKEVLDQVILTDGLVLTNQSIGIADKADGFQNVDGILGVGPVRLTKGTLSPSDDEIIPTVTDNAFRLGLIPYNQIAIYFQPTDVEEVVNGELAWGGVDKQKYTGEINFAPITSTFPASMYWGIDQNITYGDSTEILQYTAGIVDTGTTLVYLATDAYDRYAAAAGATMDDSVGLLKIPCSKLKALKSLFFNINGVSYEFTANAQIWPRSLNTAIGGDASSIYLTVSDLGKSSGFGLDFINGYTFLERFYTVYDTANSQIGFATTPFTNATSN